MKEGKKRFVPGSLTVLAAMKTHSRNFDEDIGLRPRGPPCSLLVENNHVKLQLLLQLWHLPLLLVEMMSSMKSSADPVLPLRYRSRNVVSMGRD